MFYICLLLDWLISLAAAAPPRRLPVTPKVIAAIELTDEKNVQLHAKCRTLRISRRSSIAAWRK